MRLLLAISLLLLFLWLYGAQSSDDTSHGNPCAVEPLSRALVSLVLSPLSLYSWLSSTLFRLILSAPGLILSSLHHSVLLLLAWPWSAAAVVLSLLLTWLRVGLYLLHLALVVGALAFLTLARDGSTGGEAVAGKVLWQRENPEGCNSGGRRSVLAAKRG